MNMSIMTLVKTSKNCIPQRHDEKLFLFSEVASLLRQESDKRQG